MGFTFRVTDENKFKLQTQMLPNGPKRGLEVDVAVNSEGCALTQFISSYNVQSATKGAFDLTVSPTSGNSVEVCAAYTGSKDKTNMVVIALELPSGYGLQEGQLNEVKRGMVKLVEYDQKSNSVALYFNEMPKNQICTELKLQKLIQVSSIQNSIAKIYDYYDQIDKSSVQYAF